MKRPELLAPAGSYEHFAAAAENGADAIYFGGKLFNARQYAENFDRAEMEKAVKYAHSKNVKVHMTVNTLIKQNELGMALIQAREGAECGVDAFIVQDLGMAELLKRELPEVPIHMSTQATVYDKAGVEFARDMGCSRVVLARELSLEKIKECADVEGIETEVFVHGALCMCLSGQCAMSSLIGKRSGNRGSCAQPCRKRYAIEDGEGKFLGEPGYLLSPRDISYVGELKALIDAGVDSFKIEGRLKTAEYTAAAVRTFRKYIDRVLRSDETETPEQKDMEILEQVFSRGSFSKGYLYGKQNGALLSGESPKHRGLFLGVVKNTKPSAISPEKKLIELELRRSISAGDGIEIMAPGYPGGVVSYIRGRNGKSRLAEAGEKVWLGDIPGKMRAGDMVYKVTDSVLNKSIRSDFEKKAKESAERKTPVKGRFTACEGKPIRYEVADDMGRVGTAEGTLVIGRAESRPADEETVLKQLSRTGNTPFVLSNCVFEMEEGLMIPLSEINKVRRKAMELLEKGEHK